jgi:ElaB/YqjD/DUF883 family membrane-anchored ribosome-binding protein
MYRNDDVLSPGVLSCGCAAEAVPFGHIHGEGFAAEPKSRLGELKSKARAKINNTQRAVMRATSSVRDEAMHKVDDMRRSTAIGTERVRRGAQRTLANANQSMRTSPMKWVGVAAGAGFGLGLMGRLLDHRRHHQLRSPQLVIIETEC